MLLGRKVATALAIVPVLSAGLFGLPQAHAAGTAVSTYVGGAGFGDGGPAIDARITMGWPRGGQVTTDPQGRVVFADPAANEIRRIDTDGTFERIAGNGDHAGSGHGFSGEGAGFSGDGGPATQAALSGPTGVQIASDGTMYIADGGNARIRKVAPDGTISTIAGTGTAGTSATTQDAATALVSPGRLRLAPNGDLFFTESDTNYADVRKIDSQGEVSLVAGNVTASTQSYDTSPCASDPSSAIGQCFESPTDAVIDDNGTVYISDSDSIVYKVDGTTLTRLSGAYRNFNNTGDGGPATDATLSGAYALALDGAGDLLVQTTGEIRSITPAGAITEDRPLASGLAGISTALSGTDLIMAAATTLASVSSDGTVTTLAGAAPNGTGDGLPATEAAFLRVVGVVATPDGGTLVGDAAGRVWKIDNAGIAHRVAGSLSGQSAFSGEGAPATAAVLPPVTSIAGAADGAIYVGSTDGAVRRVDPAGLITTVAGTGSIGNGPDTATAATGVAMGRPTSLVTTANGTVYILDADNNRLRALAGGTLTTVAGTGAAVGRSAVGQSLAALDLHGVSGLATAPDGSLRITATTLGYPWMYTVTGGTVTKAQRFPESGNPALDAAGDTFVGAGYGLLRLFPDGSEEQLTSYDDGGYGSPVVGIGGDGDVWWAKDGYPGMAGQRVWRAPVSAAAPRPAAITGLAFHWDKDGPYVSWQAPQPGVNVFVLLRHGKNAAAANPSDGYDLSGYLHSALPNTASIVFGESDDPPVQGDYITVSVFPHNDGPLVVGAPTVATFLFVAPTACAIKSSARTVLYGKSVGLTGTLTSLGSALPGKPATITGQAVGKSTVTLKSATTSSTGTMVASQAPAANTTYTFRRANDAFAACAASVAVTVQPKIVDTLAATIIHRGTHTTLTATVEPNLYGQYVILQRYGGTSWHTVSSLRLNRLSKAAWAVGSATSATLHYRVVKAADKYHAASIGPMVTLKVT
jgi:hypothetical protein